MLLKKIKLENIRSYTFQEFEFPTGSTLLAGDIGSGKSTILLAIDFALFGVSRSTLPGASLLRNGAEEGSVELSFSIDENEYVIKRNLSKSSDGVKQDSGYLIVNGVKKDLTAMELRQHILNILNYPQEMLTKSKSLIYRYTVYTPQEQMKQILIGEEELRLDTLRRVFGIEKYKQIKENSKIFLQALKEKRKLLEGSVSDIESKKLEKVNLENEMKESENEIIFLEPAFLKIKEAIETKKKELLLIEEQIKKFSEFKNLVSLKKNLSSVKQNQLNKNNLSVTNLKRDIELLKKETEAKENLEALLNEIQSKELVLNEKQLNLEGVNQKIQNLIARKLHSQEIIDKIKDLENCPTCQQPVSSVHKTNVFNEENIKINSLDSSLSTFKRDKTVLTSEIDEVKIKLDQLKKKNIEHDIVKLKILNLQEKEKYISDLINDSLTIQNEIEILNSEIGKINVEISQFSDVDMLYSKLKSELEVLRSEERELDIKKANILSRIENKKLSIERVSKEIEKKEELRKKMNYLVQIQTWIEEYFINLMDLMEKNVMMKAHTDFDSLFEKWTSLLLDNENIVMKLDNLFTPIIEQNEHNIEYDFLSGGEKTAAALAYRLALNQVINNLMVDIKTKDLIILDEPTDGFSREQLERMRLVLDELKIKQVIIVSHEAQIESFVQNVIRLKKEGHVSSIV